MELQLKELGKSYGKKRALSHVNLSLKPGVYGLLGPNGAGKSTMMNIITGNLTPDEGSVLLDSKDIRTLGSAYRDRIGYMPQQQVFYPGFTVEHFLYYIGSLRGLSKRQAREQIDRVLPLLDLSSLRKQTIRSLSGGMRQRLLLAQAILAEPDILILDEPTAGLDPSQRIAVRNLIGEIAANRIVLISTHVVSDVEFVANQIILLSEGRVLSHLPPYELAAELEGKVWEFSIPDSELPHIRTMGLVCGLTRGRDGILVRMLSDTPPSLDAKTVRPGLEDVYLHYFGEPDLS